MRNFIVTIDGKSYSVGVEEVGETQQNAIPVASTSNPAPVAPQAINAAGEKVASPFPGLIKKILVNDGDTVKKDQAIIVLEAMKMDNDITAPCDGRVSIRVTAGANVETGAILAIIG